MHSDFKIQKNKHRFEFEVERETNLLDFTKIRSQKVKNIFDKFISLLLLRLRSKQLANKFVANLKLKVKEKH
jgi:hypothetical protein